MHTGFWFNRLIEYWTWPTANQVVDRVRRGKGQLVQMGNFGGAMGHDYRVGGRDSRHGRVITL